VATGNASTSFSFEPCLIQCKNESIYLMLETHVKSAQESVVNFPVAVCALIFQQGAVYGDAFARAHHGTQLPPTQQDAGREGRTRLRLEERFCWVLPDWSWIGSFPPFLARSWAHVFLQRCDCCRQRPSPPTGIEPTHSTLRHSAFTPARQQTPTGTFPPLPSARDPPSRSVSGYLDGAPVYMASATDAHRHPPPIHQYPDCIPRRQSS
jgi:hypothetical protein